VFQWRILMILIALGMPGTARSQAPRDVPLTELIARPEAHHGQTVRSHGFMVLEFEGTILWVSEADFRAERYDRAVWLDTRLGAFEPHPLSGRRVFVSGRFTSGRVDGRSFGHLGLTDAVIGNISRIEPDPSDTDRARAWRDDPLLVILASLGLLGLFMAVARFGLRGFPQRPTP
jgi:hypothetical protein